MFVFGHRGAKGEAPENTLAGFRHAVANDVPGVELDVRLSRDEQVVVIHDATVDRTTDGEGEVAGLTAAELAELDARADFPDWPEPCGVPTLDEAFDVLSGRDVQVEIKEREPERVTRLVGLVADILRRRGNAAEVIATSFHAPALAAMRQAYPDGLRCALIGAFTEPEHLAAAVDAGCQRINIFRRQSTPQMRDHAGAAGLRFGGGPCNDEETLETYRGWGYEWTTSDVPTRIAALARRS